LRCVGTVMALDLSMPVLVVDDYRSMIRIMGDLLRQLGFSDIDGANDGAEALTRMRARRYGLVISDWCMEPMSGAALIEEVKADPALAATPVIVVSAEAGAEEARRAGASSFLTKPFNARTLKGKIEAVLGA
jgi:two-component system, chemotaxis family, chemotaxis protein CheY